MINLLGCSDALNQPTGFGRVARELFTRLPQDEFRLGYMAHGWPGSARFPGIQTYGEMRGGPNENICQAIFPYVALDFAGPTDPFLLFTLLDPWQTGWLAFPETNGLRHPLSASFIARARERFRWVAYFPVDGAGPGGNRPPRFTEQYLDGADCAVLMSEWAQRLCAPHTRRPPRWISHAVHEAFAPGDRAEARAFLEGKYFRALERAIRISAAQQGVALPPADLLREVEANKVDLSDRFTVLCVMANRARKYWPTVLRAFAMLAEKEPDARLVGVCGDRLAQGQDAWELEDICRELGLRLDQAAPDPNVWLLQYVSESPEREDESLRRLYAAADACVMVSGGEGFGLPQLEAHACGRPCVVGDYSASSELIVHTREAVAPRGFMALGKNEVMRPIYDARDVADRLLFLARSPALRAEIGAAGLKQAEGRRWSVILPQWVELFREFGLRPKEAADGPAIHRDRPHPAEAAAAPAVGP